MLSHTQECFEASSAEKPEQLIVPWCQLKIISAPSKKEKKNHPTTQPYRRVKMGVTCCYFCTTRSLLTEGGEQMLA